LGEDIHRDLAVGMTQQFLHDLHTFTKMVSAEGIEPSTY
jgi:hypothetical protein